METQDGIDSEMESLRGITSAGMASRAERTKYAAFFDDVMAANPTDPAKMARTTDRDIATQIASDPDTAPDLGDMPIGEFVVRRS